MLFMFKNLVPCLEIKKNRDPLRAVNILMKKWMGHTAVSAT